MGGDATGGTVVGYRGASLGTVTMDILRRGEERSEHGEGEIRGLVMFDHDSGVMLFVASLHPHLLGG